MEFLVPFIFRLDPNNGILDFTVTGCGISDDRMNHANRVLCMYEYGLDGTVHNDRLK
jgi:hypothetical protein